MPGTGRTHVLVLAAVVLLVAATVAERRPRMRRAPQGLGGLSQSYDYAPSNLNLGSSASIGPALSDFGGLGGLTGLSGLNFGGFGGFGSFGEGGGGLNYNFDLGGSSNSFASDFNFPNFGSFPQLGQKQSNPYIPPVSRVLKEGINAFLPAGAKKILPGDKAYVEFESALSDERPKLEPIIKNLGGKNPFDVIRQTATNPLQTAFTKVIDDPTYSPLPFPKSDEEQTKELTRHVEEELLKIDKQLTKEEKNTQNVYQSIDGVSLATSSSKPVGEAVLSADAKGHESTSSNTNHHRVIPPPENYVSHDGFPITDDSKLSPFQSQSKITSAISMKQHMLQIPGRVEAIDFSILPPSENFDEVSNEDKHTIVGQPEDKKTFEFIGKIEPQPANPKPEMVRHFFAKPGVHPQKLQPIGRPEHSRLKHKLQGQEIEHFNSGDFTGSNNYNLKATPKPEEPEDFYLGLFRSRRPTSITKPSFPTNEQLLKPNAADKNNSENDRHSDILQQFGLRPLPKPPQVESTTLLSGAEILSLVKKSNPPPPFPPAGDFSLGPSTTVETVVPPELKSEQTSETEVHLSLESPPEKIDGASLPVPNMDEANASKVVEQVDSSDLSEIEGADRVSAFSRDTSSLEVRDVIDSPGILVTAPSFVHPQLSEIFDHGVITNETMDDTDLKFKNRTNNLSFNVSADINDKTKRDSNNRPETSPEASNDEFIETTVIERPVLESVTRHLEPRDFTLSVLEASTTHEVHQLVEPKSDDAFKLADELSSVVTTKNGSSLIEYSEELDESNFFGLAYTLNTVTSESKAIPLVDTTTVPVTFLSFSNETVFNHSNPYLKSIYENHNSHFERPSIRISKIITRPPTPFSSTERTYAQQTIFPPSKFVSLPTTKPWSLKLTNVSASNLDEQLKPNSDTELFNLSYFAGESPVNILLYKLTSGSRDLEIRNSSHEVNGSQYDNLKLVPRQTFEKF